MVNHTVQLTSFPETIEEEGSDAGSPGEEDTVCPMDPHGKPDGGLELPTGSGKEQRPLEGTVVAPVPKSEGKAAEIQKLRRLEQAGIKVMPAAQRFARLALLAGWLHACLEVWNLAGMLAFTSCFPTFSFAIALPIPAPSK